MGETGGEVEDEDEIEVEDEIEDEVEVEIKIEVEGMKKTLRGAEGFLYEAGCVIVN
jgi:hypothetical protein